MHLKSLTLRGFKSFASATTLNFEPGITCVVGPNGSGKSNVVDALSWVMGEQGAKTLRGGKMEDVIFAGTSARAPLGRAEVSLTIDNTDGALPIEYTEVTISRTMFRAGGSEYKINGHTARLLDVQELLSDSGIGREMHVIVGQGQLDAILQATPEIRRGFIEEAAGVLKHRKRKEKALRKLDATQANLDRLADLVAEIRRQLKPLGRQAEVARKAAIVQAELRDAKARLLADDYVMATLALESDLAAEAELKARRLAVEEALEAARQAEAEAEASVTAAAPALTQAQETWYALAGLRERVSSTLTIAGERVRNASRASTQERRGRDPEAIEAEAATIRASEEEIAAQVAERAAALASATGAREAAEKAYADAEKHYNAQLRAIADRREGLARLTGEVNSLRSRLEASDAEIGRLRSAAAEARERSETARKRFTALETEIGGLTDGEAGLDAAYEEAEAARAAADAEVKALRARERQLHQERAALAARVEGLKVGLDRPDASGALLAAAGELAGILGSVDALVRVEPGFEAAVAAALGAAAEAVAVDGVDAALEALSHLKRDDAGRARLVLAGATQAGDRSAWPALPAGVRYAVDVVRCDDALAPALARLLHRVAVVADLDAARTLVAANPDLTVATRDGDLLSAWFSTGGSSAKPSLLEVQVAVDEASAALEQAQADTERTAFELAAATTRLQDATGRAEAALARLHESDAHYSALAEELGRLSQAARTALAEAERHDGALARAEEARGRNAASLEGLAERLRVAQASTDVTDADPAERDRLAREAARARQAEMEARLALRTDEERARALAGRADALLRAARAERQARAEASARAEKLRREAEVAQAAQVAAEWLLARIADSADLAAKARKDADERRVEADRRLQEARRRSRDLAREFESLVDVVHRDELARAEQRMRIEALEEKALAELGLTADVLAAEYGPDQLVPVLTASDDEAPPPRPFVRAEQEKRLRAAQRNLDLLGRVNPLALEEFEAASERHRFLAEQLDDLKRTRTDLLGLIADVDARVEQVFAEAYADVEVAFRDSFARLFPGGEGRLILTEPGNWLTTGVDVEARPAGKKVKRLSLLSGGERSLVAVAFLTALFTARPSPFYILDEVEAALDDVNLGRLLGIYEELRASSQMIVITHQKRTMEIADALYGVTMHEDGISTVISQRLREG
ncbi:MAG: chromosome segregation protein SMC [Propioniciclava sp.]|uniref:chromosome segregation protein SMC n=1 Tax=Propioniciclava sp. TaxID=2038686 RepID=UPI0039E60CA5